MSDPTAARATEQEVDEVFKAIAELPPDRHATVQRRLARVIADYSKNGRVDPVLQFVRSIFVTVHLHGDPSYNKDYELAQTEAIGSGRSVKNVLADLKANAPR